MDQFDQDKINNFVDLVIDEIKNETKDTKNFKNKVDELAPCIGGEVRWQ